MKIKYVYHGLISLYFNFHNNRTMWSTNLLVKKLQVGGGKEKEPKFPLIYFYHIGKAELRTNHLRYIKKRPSTSRKENVTEPNIFF